MFGPAYAEAYDALYADKDYGAQCALITRLFRDYGRAPVRSILDLGCGTGEHLIRLASRDCEGVGVDRSEGMLSRARAKQGSHASFQQGDIRALDLGRTFDAVLMMDAVLGYQLKDSDALAALAAASRHLRPGGLFLFDIWHGPAVLRQGPSPRIKEVSAGGRRIRRRAEARIDAPRPVCAVRYRFETLAQGRETPAADEIDVEVHRMRFFFATELEGLLELSGLRLLRLGAFPDFDRDPTDADWDVMGVARALE